MLKHHKEQSPYKAIQDSSLLTAQLTEISSMEASCSNPTYLSQKYQPVTHENQKSRIPIGNKSKEKISSIKSRRQNSEEYFEKQLEIRTLQSQKLLEELQETKNQLNRVEKECWIMKNQYESQKRKVVKMEKQNARLNQEVKDLEKRMSEMGGNANHKRKLSEKYQDSLQSLREELKEQKVMIENLRKENQILVRQKQDLEKNGRSKTQQGRIVQNIKRSKEPMQQLIFSSSDNSKFSTSRELSTTTRFMNNLLPPPSSLGLTEPSNSRPYSQHIPRSSSNYVSNIYYPNKDSDHINPTRYMTVQTCCNLPPRAYDTEMRKNSYDTNNLESVRFNSTIQPSSHHKENYEPLSGIPPRPFAHENNFRRYPPSARTVSKSERKFSYDHPHAKLTEAPLGDITQKYRNNERYTPRMYRKEKVNEGILKKCKMILDY